MFADEGVLHGRAVVVYDISRGETNQLKLEVPKTALVNRIDAPKGGLSDWVESASGDTGSKTIQVFLDRQVKGNYTLVVTYERLLSAAEVDAPVRVPLSSSPRVSQVIWPCRKARVSGPG